MTLHLCDSNVWLAMALSGHVHQAAASAWFDTVEEPGSALFCRASQQSFLRLLSSRAVLAPYRRPPLTNREAWRAFQALLADERVSFRPQEPSGLEQSWKQLAVCSTAEVGGCITRGLREQSSDGEKEW